MVHRLVLFVSSQVLEMFTADFPKSSWSVAARYVGTADKTVLHYYRLSIFVGS